MVGIAAWNWPTHQYAERPGSVLDLNDRVHIEGRQGSESISGSFDGLTIRLTPLDLGGLLMHGLTGDPSVLLPEHAIRPPDIDPAAYHAYEKAAFVDGGQVAAAVAERSLGYTATVTSDGLEIYQVAPNRAASGELTSGELITAANGLPIAILDDLSSVVRAANGRPVELTITDAAGANQRDVSITPTTIDGSAGPVLGVVVGEANPKIDLEVPVTIDASGVEGPSAEMMTALTVYDELSSVDLAAGRTIAGTGTISLDGNVGEIGGIEAKARAAATAGADLFLAPASQAEAARTVLGGRMPVIGVMTFDDAVRALQAPRASAFGSVPEVALRSVHRVSR